MTFAPWSSGSEVSDRRPPTRGTYRAHQVKVDPVDCGSLREVHRGIGTVQRTFREAEEVFELGRLRAATR